jgi:hypothetical protein
MADFQQQSRMRKLICIGLIGILFFVSIGLRRVLLEPTAESLEIREQSLGEVELTGSAVRLMLTGSRGFAVCGLWVAANEKQKKHEWNKLELLVNSIIKLQPHFIEPWLYQSWNLAYNVSVESDRVKDKYFYVSRGIELIAEGERRNKDNPDLRQNIGFYYQNKLGMSDENNYFRSLFQMSVIDPRERDPKRFVRNADGKTVIDQEQFLDFCQKHPTLVRRLNDKLGYNTPDKIVEFLKDNQRIPSLFDEDADTKGEQTPKKPLGKGFPILPPPSRIDKREISNADVLNDDFDNFKASRAWMTYSQEPYEDPNLRRPARRPALEIWLGYPARAQAYYAERIEQSGWFDEDGWKVPDDWFGRPVVLGADRFWAGDEWRRAFEMYEDHGTRHGIYKTPEQIASMSQDDRREYEYKQRLTNFNHFYYRSEVEKNRDAVQARKLFYLADRARSTPRKAVALYRNPAAFGPPESWWGKQPTGWKKILLEHEQFRRDMFIQEESYEAELKYLELERQLSEGLHEQLKWVAVLGASPPPSGGWASSTGLFAPAALLAADVSVPFPGPLEGNDSAGQPIISRETKEMVSRRIQSLTPKRPPQGGASSASEK